MWDVRFLSVAELDEKAKLFPEDRLDFRWFQKVDFLLFDAALGIAGIGLGLHLLPVGEDEVDATVTFGDPRPEGI